MNFLDNLKLKVLRKTSVISVIGLGYVGLPVAYNFSLKFKVYGFDIDNRRVNELKAFYDRNESLSKKQLKKKTIIFEKNFKKLSHTDIFILTTPTPINKNFKPDLQYIIKALDLIIKIGVKEKIIILESTVYPGASSDFFIKYIEKKTKLKVNKDFGFGYSPERINPGDKKHRFHNIGKVVAGSSKQITSIVSNLYKSVVKKVYKSSSIKSAETAKLLENTQRDLNIAFINEIAIACDKLKLSFSEVFKLASTKWNFIKFKPGLVGGHCIGVDPYYLFHSLIKEKYRPKLLLSGRNLNENFPEFLCKKFLKELKKNKPNILIMGATYKGNCNDIRNSKSFALYDEFIRKKCSTVIYDPHVDKSNIQKLKKYKFVLSPKKNFYDGIFISVDHNKFKQMGYKEVVSFGNKNCKIFDMKNILKKTNKIIHL